MFAPAPGALISTARTLELESVSSTVLTVQPFELPSKLRPQLVCAADDKAVLALARQLAATRDDAKAANDWIPSNGVLVVVAWFVVRYTQNFDECIKRIGQKSSSPIIGDDKKAFDSIRSDIGAGLTSDLIKRIKQAPVSEDPWLIAESLLKKTESHLLQLTNSL